MNHGDKGHTYQGNSNMGSIYNRRQQRRANVWEQPPTPAQYSWMERLMRRGELARERRYNNPNIKGPMDTLIIGDSICKYVDKVRHSQIISFPGINCSELAQLIVRDKIPQIHNKEVIMIHAGTNDLDFDWLDTVYCITHLIFTIRDMYPNTHIIWSDILPRPARTVRHDREQVRTNIIKINNMMRSRQRHLGIAICPSHTSFHDSKYPLRKLFARDFLHLKPKGTFLLRELFRQHLIRLRGLWNLEVWPVNRLDDPETIIDRYWKESLCSDSVGQSRNIWA